MMRTCLLALGIWASVIMPCSAQAQDDGQADARGIERTSKQTFAEVKDLPADLKPPVFDGATATVSGVGYFSAPNGGAKQSFPIVDRTDFTRSKIEEAAAIDEDRGEDSDR